VEKLIKTDNLPKIDIKHCVELIKKSINEKRPILIRHHADCDGYSGGVALERVILLKMHGVHNRESDLFYYYKRFPSKTPYYDIKDATKDLSAFLADSGRFERKKPLIIVVDNGSTKQDLLSLKKLKLYNAKIIVIDHHPAYEENNNYIDVHVNPHLNGCGSEITAGMLCTEIASTLAPNIEKLELLAALAGVADYSRGEEIDKYLKLAEEKGFNEEKLKKIILALDFEFGNIGFLESRKLVNDLLFGDLDKQTKLVDLLYSEAKVLETNRIQQVKHYAQILKNHDIAIVSLELSDFWGYPRAGRTTTILRELTEEKEKKPVVALGVSSEFISFRFSDSLDYDVNKIISHLKEKFPFSDVDGGGHAKAGTVRFLAREKNNIFEEIKRYFDVY